MAVVVAALLPVFLLIVLGFVLKRTLMRLETQWHGLERLTYYVLFPMLLIQTLVKADLAKVPVAGVGGALMLSALAMSLFCLALRPAARARWHRRARLHLDLPGRDALADLCRARRLRQSLWRRRPGAGLRRHGRDHPAGQCVQRRGARPLRFAGKAVGPRSIVDDGGAQSADLGLRDRARASMSSICPCRRSGTRSPMRSAAPRSRIGLLVTGAGLHLEGLFRPSAGRRDRACFSSWS